MIIQILPPVSNHEVTNTVTLRIEQTVSSETLPRWSDPTGQAGASHPSTIRRSVFRGDITKKKREKGKKKSRCRFLAGYLSITR